MRVTRSMILCRGVTNRCPNCGQGTLFREDAWFKLNPACPTCGLRFERDEGFFLGSMSLNYGVTIVCFLVPVLALYLTGVLSGFVAALLATVGAIGVPILFYRSSRSWFLANYYLFLPHHLPANRNDAAVTQDENT